MYASTHVVFRARNFFHWSRILSKVVALICGLLLSDLLCKKDCKEQVHESMPMALSKRLQVTVFRRLLPGAHLRDTKQVLRIEFNLNLAIFLRCRWIINVPFLRITLATLQLTLTPTIYSLTPLHCTAPRVRQYLGLPFSYSDYKFQFCFPLEGSAQDRLASWSSSRQI